MLNKTSIYLRLLLCLLLSGAVHGGVIYLGWLEAPIHLAVEAPVEISFLPVVDIAQPAAQEKEQAVTETVEKQEPELVKKDARKPEPKPRNKPLPEREPKPAIERKPQEIVEASVPEPEPVEPVEQQVVENVPAAEQLQSKEAMVVEPVASAQADKEIPVKTTSSADVIEAVPRYRSNPLPEYPYLARQRHWEGVVWLIVDVSADGLVDDLSVESSSGYKILDRAATRAVARWRFEPATRGGIPVASKARIPVRFRLEGR